MIPVMPWRSVVVGVVAMALTALVWNSGRTAAAPPSNSAPAAAAAPAALRPRAALRLVDRPDVPAGVPGTVDAPRPLAVLTYQTVVLAAPFLPAPEVSAASLAMGDGYFSQRSRPDLPNACGPASLLMALRYFGVPASFDDVVQRSRLYAPEAGGYDPACARNAVCLSPAVLETVARDGFGLHVEARAGWTLEAAQQALAQGRPIIADILWRPSAGRLGHFVVIYGIDLGQRLVYYHDPYYGPGQAADWESFAALWEGPVDVGDPLAPDGHHAWGLAVSLP